MDFREPAGEGLSDGPSSIGSMLRMGGGGGKLDIVMCLLLNLGASGLFLRYSCNNSHMNVRRHLAGNSEGKHLLFVHPQLPSEAEPWPGPVLGGRNGPHAPSAGSSICQGVAAEVYSALSYVACMKGARINRIGEAEGSP